MKKIINNIPFALVLLLIVFRPHGIVNYFSDLDKIWKLLLILLAVFFTIVYIKEYKIDKLILYVFCYNFIVIFSTIINSANFEFCLSKLLPSWIIFLYSIMFIKDNPQKYLKSLYMFSIIISIVNLISIYMNPNGIGLEDYYFLGLDNMAAMNLIIGGVFIWLYRHIMQKNRFITLLLLLIPVYQLIYVDCSTGIVGAIILIGLFIFFDFIKNIKIFNYKNYVFLSLILFLAIVIFRLQDRFEFLIVNILHKDLTFTLRTYIWDEAMLVIKDNLFLGIGYKYAHYHCNYLDIICKFGIIGFGTYLLNLFNINKKISVEEKKNTSEKYVAKIISFGFLIYFMMTIVEVYMDSQYFYVLMVIAYYSNIISSINHNKEEKTT